MKKRNIGFLYLLFGFLFLSSPDILIFDFLPDFIGYFLILAGLSRLADIDERAMDAKRGAVKLLVLSSVKFVLSFYLASLHKTNLLLVAFTLATLNVVLIIPFLKDLFHSIDYTATRQGVTLSQKKITEAHILFVMFFVIKDILMVVPSVISLVDPAETGDFDSRFWYIDFKALSNVLVVLCFFFMALFGLFMALKCVMFFRYLLKNRELCEKLYENYDRTVLQVPSRLISKATTQTRAAILVSLVFFVDFYIDFIDVLPTVVGFLLMFLFSVILQKKMQISTRVLSLLSLVGTVVSAAAFYYRFYWQKQLGAAIEYSFSAKKYTLILALASTVLMFLSLLLSFKAVSDTAKKYLGTARTSRFALLSVLSLVLAVFDFILFAYPEMNSTFVFPNIIFAAAFVAIAYDFVKEVSAEILNRYKNKDF